MKKLMFAVTVMAAAVATAEMKIGTVDLMVLVRNHPDYGRNKALIEQTSKDYEAKLGEIKGEGDSLQAEGKKLAEQYRNPMLNDKAKSDIEKKIQEIQQKLLGIEQRYRAKAMSNRQELSDLEGRLLKATTEDLRKRINAIAEKSGYDFVFDKTATPFAKAEYEITDVLLRDMGVDPVKAKGRHEGK